MNIIKTTIIPTTNGNNTRSNNFGQSGCFLATLSKSPLRAALFLSALTAPSVMLPCQAGAARITVDASQTGPRIPRSLYGVFLEEISHSEEGGLYAELIQNRGFEDADIPPGCHIENGFLIPPRTPHFWEGHPVDWKMPWDVHSPYPAWSLKTGDGSSATIGLVESQPLNSATPHSMRVNITKVTPGSPVSLINEGFWGIAVKEKASYNLSFYARSDSNYRGPITASLLGQDGKVLASSTIAGKPDGTWHKFTATLTATAADPKAKFALNFGASGTLNLDFVSLFPAQTFKGRPNGMRPELAQMIADLKPGFVRWPGGCFVEGLTIETRPQWKQTIGPIEGRIATYSPWQYWDSNGMGYHEYLQFCEDVHADALYVANVGVSCAFRSGTYLPDDQVPGLIQDTLDAIEYAIGPVTSKWGAVRAKNGHPAPFPLKYIEIGNEQSGARYGARVKQFTTAIKAKYPQIQVALSSWIAGIDQEAIDAAGKIDIVDEHAYKPLYWPITNFDSFAKYPRTVPWQLYIGEFATNSNVGNGNLQATLNDAAYMMSMEKNSDLVKMGSYAPLLENINDTDWNVNMIHFDSARIFGRATYYACKMFADQLPDVNLKTDFQYTPSRPLSVGGGIGLGTWNTSAEFKDVTVESDDQTLYQGDFTKGLEGWRQEGEGKWSTDGGVLSQPKNVIGWNFLDKPEWKNLTISFKARKLAGSEGFIVVLGKAEGQQVQVNFGGWGNIQHAVQVSDNITGNAIPGRIETGKWYDVKVQADGDTVRAWLDGKLVDEVKLPRTDVVLSIAGRDEKTGDIIIKAINSSAEPAATEISIKGAPNLQSTGELQVLTSKSPGDENSFDNPTKIVPVDSVLTGVAPSFTHTLPPYSLSILRLKTR